jgi:plasmid maintenance system killer protein
VIVSYRDKRPTDFAAGKRVKALSGVERPARLKLDRVEAALTLKDLAALPGNRLEALKATERASTAFGLMTNGGSALNGRGNRRDRRTWRLWIITRENTWHALQFTQGSTWPKNLTP